MVGSETHEEYLERLQAEKSEFTPYEQAIIGGWVRLEVPFHSTSALKRWRALMGGYLASIDYLLSPALPGAPAQTPRARMCQLRMEASQINRMTRGYKGPGRPRKNPQATCNKSGDNFPG